jgi:hypothetical protein
MPHCNLAAQGLRGRFNLTQLGESCGEGTGGASVAAEQSSARVQRVEVRESRISRLRNFKYSRDIFDVSQLVRAGSTFPDRLFLYAS